MALVGILITAGCGSSSSPGNRAQPPLGSLEALAQGPGQTVAITPGDADFAPGPIRFSFLVIARDGRVVLKPMASVWLSRGLKQSPFQRATARLEPIGVPGVSALPDGVPSIYVVHLSAPAPGTYWLLAKPRGSAIDALGNVVVHSKTFSPAVGRRVPASATPTLATTGGRLAPLTTSTHPDSALYTTSVAQALAAHEPFVLAFATPKFCTSRTCGPVVDVLAYVQRKLAGTPVRFIHVEVFEDNDPAKGYNRWMKEWRLQSEPWVFLVGRDGRLQAKFEGSVSVAELMQAIRTTLLA
jgi:hypothetical protein